MRDLFEDAVVFVRAAFAVAGIVAGILAGGIAGVATDYFIKAESTVNAINAQCGTQYEKLDYLRIGQNAMLQMC